MKIQKRNDKGRGEKKHQTKKAPLIRLTCQHQIHVGSEHSLQYRKKKKKERNKKTQKQPPSRPLSSRLDTARCLLFMFSVRSHSQWHSLQGVQTINCTWQEVKLYIYIYKKTKNIKQCENSDHFKINKKKREHLNHHIIIIFVIIQKVLLATNNDFSLLYR